MRTDLFELTSELFDQDLRIDPVLEPLHAEALVTELAVEALVRSVLPGLAWIDVGSVNAMRDHRVADPKLSRRDIRRLARCSDGERKINQVPK